MAAWWWGLQVAHLGRIFNALTEFCSTSVSHQVHDTHVIISMSLQLEVKLFCSHSIKPIGYFSCNTIPPTKNEHSTSAILSVTRQ